MRVGMVLDDTLDTPDGVQQYVLSIGSWLSSQGHEVHYLVGKTSRTDITNVHPLSRNVAVRFNGNRMSMPLPTSRRHLRAFLVQYNFDVLHVQVPYSPFMAGRLIRLAPAKTAVVGTFHILPYSALVKLANRCLGLWNRRSGKRFNRMLAVSEPARRYAEAVYGYKNLQVVPNAVRLEQFTGAKSDSQTLNIVFLGRLVERKGALQLLKAVAFVCQNNLFSGNFIVHIGGKGELLPQLQAFVRDNKLEHVVQFDGFISEANKADYLAAADIAVFPSSGGESFGIVLLEAMAAARGVVLAGNNPGYASVMAPFSEQVFETSDIPAFAALLAKWLASETARKQLAVQQHSYVAQFDLAVVGAQVLANYEEALQSRH